MNPKSIPRLLLTPALILLVAGCGGNSPSLTEEIELAAAPSSPAHQKTGEQTAILGQIRYDIECIDDALGMDRSNEIFDDKESMTPAETDKVRHCIVESSEETDATPKTAAPSSPSHQKTGGQSAILGQIRYDIECIDDALGMDRSNEIFDDKESMTPAETDKVRHCIVESSEETDATPKTAAPSSPSHQKTGGQSAILGQIRYDIECIDDALGMDRSNEIFDDKESMTPAETDKVRHCTMESSEETDATPKTAAPSSPSHQKTGGQSAILGQIRYDIECIDDALGMDRSNEIFDNKEGMTPAETDKVRHCTMESSEETDATPKTAAPSSPSHQKTGGQSAILGQIRYDIECIDDALGMDRSNEIFDNKEGMTPAETDKVRHCTMESSKETDATPKTAAPSSPSHQKTGGQSAILGQTRYDIECIDDALGMDRSNEIFDDKVEMTSEEMDKVGHCTVASSKGGDATSETNERNQGNGGISRPKLWTPSPNQTECLFAAIGAKEFREIRQGDRLATTNEVKAAEPCLAGVAGSPSLNSLPHPLSTEQCPSLETLEQNLKEYRPRWDQLECHMKDLKRSPIPSFSTNASISPVVISGGQGIGMGPRVPKVDANVWRGDLDDLLDSMDAESWEQYAGALYDHWYRDVFKSLLFSEAEFPSANASMISMTAFPPYIDEFYNLVHYPPTDYWHDELLRSFAVHILQRKQTGHITAIANLYPPFLAEDQKVVAPAKNPEEFRVWIDEVFIPQKIHEAKMAEALKVEILHPWPAEADTWVMYQHWAADASDQELLDAGQYLLDAVATAVRPYFKGRLVVSSFTPGRSELTNQPQTFWKDLSYESVDRVDFTFWMNCDEQTIATELREYMDAVMHIVKRDSVTWTIGELHAFSPSFERCGTDPYDRSDEIYSMVLDILFEQEVTPVGFLGGTTGGIGSVFSHDHKVVLEEKLFSRSAD